MGNKLKFAERLRTLLKENNMTQSELSIELGIATGAVFQWCKAMTMPTSARIVRISQLLGCDKEWLMGEDVPRDKDIKRNASGYTDPTAYKAIKEIEKEGKEVIGVRGIEKTIEKGGIYEYTLQNGMRKYALCVSDHRRHDPKTVAIFVLSDIEFGFEVYLNGIKWFINPNRLSYGYIDNFGNLVTCVSDEMMKDIEKSIVDAVGLEMPKQTIACVETEATDKIKTMILGLKNESFEKDKCIESLQNQIRTLSAECSVLSAEANRLREEKRPSNDVALWKAETERDLYKQLYEQAIQKMIG